LAEGVFAQFRAKVSQRLVHLVAPEKSEWREAGPNAGCATDY
jgi:hypothetical protein